MTREEARKLIGGYATGSLTESERASLFNAALEDQGLFNELAAEHSLKELIDSPGVRNRLVAALTPEATRPQRAWWPWAAALALGVAGFTVWMMKPRPVEAPVQVAVQEAVDNLGRYESVPPLPAKAPARTAKDVAKPRNPMRKAQPLESPVVVPEQAVTDKAEVAVVTPAAPPPPPTPPAVPPAAVTVAQALREDASRTAFLATPNANAALVQPLTYLFTPNRKLRITPTQTGLLEVKIGPQTLYARKPVVAQTPIELEIPEEALSVRIEFTPDGGTAFVVIPSVPQ